MSSAVISTDGVFRYWLVRDLPWTFSNEDGIEPNTLCAFVMLNRPRLMPKGTTQRSVAAHTSRRHWEQPNSSSPTYTRSGLLDRLHCWAQLTPLVQITTTTCAAHSLRST